MPRKISPRMYPLHYYLPTPGPVPDDDELGKLTAMLCDVACQLPRLSETVGYAYERTRAARREAIAWRTQLAALVARAGGEIALTEAELVRAEPAQLEWTWDKVTRQLVLRLPEAGGEQS